MTLYCYDSLHACWSNGQAGNQGYSYTIGLLELMVKHSITQPPWLLMLYIYIYIANSHDEGSRPYFYYKGVRKHKNFVGRVTLVSYVAMTACSAPIPTPPPPICLYAIAGYVILTVCFQNHRRTTSYAICVVCCMALFRRCPTINTHFTLKYPWVGILRSSNNCNLWDIKPSIKFTTHVNPSNRTWWSWI